jgi:hypothetical protein
MMESERFYAPNEGPPKQGDILLAGVARLVADDRFTPPPWEPLDRFDVTVDLEEDDRKLRLAVGPALVMVASHDCHFDKEWNQRRGAIIADGARPEEASRVADADDSLDRTFTASPLLRPADVARKRDMLMAGKILGYLPVPASADGLIPEAVVDLTYRVTLDRLDIVRVACVGIEARSQLRYALARLDSLRAPSVGFDLEAVVGRHIERVTFPKKQPLFVRLHLDNGTTVDLLQHPGEPEGGPARSQPPGPAA